MPLTSVKDITYKKKIIRETINGGGVFPTQVEVIEREVLIGNEGEGVNPFRANNKSNKDLGERS